MKESEDLRNLKIALGAYVLMLAIKLAGYFITGVMALMAEALHTLSDIFVSGFLLLAAYYSRKAADQVHMFGYGRAQNVAALTAATQATRPQPVALQPWLVWPAVSGSVGFRPIRPTLAAQAEAGNARWQVIAAPSQWPDVSPRAEIARGFAGAPSAPSLRR